MGVISCKCCSSIQTSKNLSRRINENPLLSGIRVEGRDKKPLYFRKNSFDQLEAKGQRQSSLANYLSNFQGEIVAEINKKKDKTSKIPIKAKQFMFSKTSQLQDFEPRSVGAKFIISKEIEKVPNNKEFSIHKKLLRIFYMARRRQIIQTKNEDETATCSYTKFKSSQQEQLAIIQMQSENISSNIQQETDDALPQIRKSEGDFQRKEKPLKKASLPTEFVQLIQNYEFHNKNKNLTQMPPLLLKTNDVDNSFQEPENEIPLCSSPEMLRFKNDDDKKSYKDNEKRPSKILTKLQNKKRSPKAAHHQTSSIQVMQCQSIGTSQQTVIEIIKKDNDTQRKNEQNSESQNSSSTLSQQIQVRGRFDQQTEDNKSTSQLSSTSEFMKRKISRSNKRQAATFQSEDSSPHDDNNLKQVQMTKRTALKNKQMANSYNEKQLYGDSFRNARAQKDITKGSQKFLSNVNIVIKPPMEEQTDNFQSTVAKNQNEIPQNRQRRHSKERETATHDSILIKQDIKQSMQHMRRRLSAMEPSNKMRGISGNVNRKRKKLMKTGPHNKSNKSQNESQRSSDQFSSSLDSGSIQSPDIIKKDRQLYLSKIEELVNVAALPMTRKRTSVELQPRTQNQQWNSSQRDVLLPVQKIKTIIEVDEEMEERSSIWGGASENIATSIINDSDIGSSYYGDFHQSYLMTDRSKSNLNGFSPKNNSLYTFGSAIGFCQIPQFGSQLTVPSTNSTNSQHHQQPPLMTMKTQNLIQKVRTSTNVTSRKDIKGQNSSSCLIPIQVQSLETDSPQSNNSPFRSNTFTSFSIRPKNTLQGFSPTLQELEQQQLYTIDARKRDNSIVIEIIPESINNKFKEQRNLLSEIRKLNREEMSKLPKNVNLVKERSIKKSIMLAQKQPSFKSQESSLEFQSNNSFSHESYTEEEQEEEEKNNSNDGEYDDEDMSYYSELTYEDSFYSAGDVEQKSEATTRQDPSEMSSRSPGGGNSIMSGNTNRFMKYLNNPLYMVEVKPLKIYLAENSSNNSGLTGQQSGENTPSNNTHTNNTPTNNTPSNTHSNKQQNPSIQNMSSSNPSNQNNSTFQMPTLVQQEGHNTTQYSQMTTVVEGNLLHLQTQVNKQQQINDVQALRRRSFTQIDPSDIAIAQNQNHLKPDMIQESNPNRSKTINMAKVDQLAGNLLTAENLSQIDGGSTGRSHKSVTTMSAISSRKDGRKKINQYLRIKEIGQGNFAKVYMCLNEQDKKTYAMKAINKRKHKKNYLQTKKQAYNFLETEMAILKKLDHPNVLQLFEIIDDPSVNKLYIITDFIQNGTLTEKVTSKKGITLDQIWKYFRDLICALEYCHDCAGIIHRDIKGENILIDENDRVKLADFGVSQIMENGNDEITTQAGSQLYFSPEACVGNKFRGRRSDVWACGVVLYFMSHRQMPFLSNDFPSLILKVQNEEPQYDLSIDPLLLDLLKGIFIKDAEKRITIPQIKVHPWMTKYGTFLMPQLNQTQIIKITEKDRKNVFTKVRFLARVMVQFKRKQKDSQIQLQSQQSSLPNGGISQTTKLQNNQDSSSNVINGAIVR